LEGRALWGGNESLGILNKKEATICVGQDDEHPKTKETEEFAGIQVTGGVREWLRGKKRIDYSIQQK